MQYSLNYSGQEGFRPLKINFPDGFRVKRTVACIV